MDDVAIPDLLDEATQRLIRTVDALSATDLAAPSLLPGWSRAHVVAHLALNAEGLEQVLTGVRRHEARPMYRSPEARDQDIEELAGSDAADLRERLLAASHCFQRALAAMTEEDREAEFERTPGGLVLHARNVPLMRWREVEIHHADLDAGHAARDWPDAFCVAVLESMTHRRYDQPFTVLARDLARTFEYGDGEDRQHVTGNAADLAWWIVGRGDGRGVTTDAHALPTIQPW